MLELVYNESNDNYSHNFKENPESHSSLENNLQICENGLKRPEQISGKTTEFEAFGLSVAAQLNTLPLVEALELQLKIQQLITTERLKKLKNEEG